MQHFQFMFRSLPVAAVAIANLIGCSGSDNGGTNGSGGNGGASASGGVSAIGGNTSTGTTSNGAVGGSVSTGGAQGAPIAGLQPQTWTWVPFADAYCRDGSTTGIGINVNPASTQLMIFLEGGGACFNEITCGLNPQSFGASDFSTYASDVQYGGGAGIFNRNDAANPVKDWNFVYIPYCTGDVHSGNNSTGAIASLGPQKFVGYANIGQYLQRIVPTFPGVTQVLLTGISAGGFGAAANYIQVANKFGSVPVYLLDDSGPMMDSPYVPACLAQLFIQTWSLDKTILADCGSDCSDTSHALIDFMKHIAKTYPTVRMGLIDSTGDSVITQFFGFGDSNCTAYAALTAQTFTAGLQDIRTQLASTSNFGTFVFQGTDHTTIETAANFDSRTSANVKLTSWVTQLLGGTVTNVGP